MEYGQMWLLNFVDAKSIANDCRKTTWSQIALHIWTFEPFKPSSMLKCSTHVCALGAVTIKKVKWIGRGGNLKPVLWHPVCDPMSHCECCPSGRTVRSDRYLLPLKLVAVNDTNILCVCVSVTCSTRLRSHSLEWLWRVFLFPLSFLRCLSLLLCHMDNKYPNQNQHANTCTYSPWPSV